ncbi:tetratricopeptide repeat protein [bacterium]|nr:tetratricopeptide repeat protein [bacterium]
MLKSNTFLFILVMMVFLFGCTGGRLTEEEYLTQAKQMLAEGNIEDAIYNYSSLVKFYPESENLQMYETQLFDLTIQAAEKYAGTPKEETYIAEALSMANVYGDTLAYWVKYRIANKTAQVDQEKASVLFKAIPIDGYYFAAQMALGKGHYKDAIEAYEKLLELYPNDAGNYKAIFLIGFNYSEYLKDYEKAKLYFERVLANYPECDLRPSAEWMLENMGKSPEDIEFIENEQPSV